MGLYRVSKELTPVTTSNFYERKFNDTGVYFFQTQSRNPDEKHICIVQVEESNRDFKIDIKDDTFDPICLTIEEGDRVWFSWTKETCKNKHCIFEIEFPTPDHSPEDPYREKENGFRWSEPTKNGLMSHRFLKSGIYYFSDQNEDESASYIGIIIVKQKLINHDIIVKSDTFEMDKDILQIEAGHKVWWKWDKQQLQTQIKFIDATLVGDKKLNTNRCKSFGVCDGIKSSAFAKLGFHCVKITKPGVYYYSVQIESNKRIATIVAYSPEKDHKVEISDAEIKPNIITINPFDRVWFLWNNTKNSHNIRQVTHKNTLIENGFMSGALTESPGAYCQSFEKPGIYYFHSDGIKNCFGAIVVVPESNIQPIRVSEDNIEPDPLVANINDLVIWILPSEQEYDIVPIKSTQDLIDYPKKAEKTFARKYFCTNMKEQGVFHFASPSFNNVFHKKDRVQHAYSVRKIH